VFNLQRCRKGRNDQMACTFGFCPKVNTVTGNQTKSVPRGA
jgi:hypothetical protein